MNVLEKLDALLNGAPENAAKASWPQSGRLAAAEAEQPLTAAARRELRPIVKARPPADPLEGLPHPSTAQFKAADLAVIERGFTPDPDVRAKLTALDVPWTRLQAAILECTGSVGAKYHAHLKGLADRVAAGDTTVQESDAWSRADWENDARERMLAFKAQAKVIESEAWTIAAPELVRKADALDAMAAELEQEAEIPFRQFSVPFEPPRYLLMIRVYAKLLRGSCRAGLARPTAMLDGI